ncbi:radical SAM protein [Anaerocolumna sp. AGMB13020]|uniref:radical SAM/SPASM domain-containing protein n=1 Tax=Anaerocolumna sp. AGMB13020 TaxID=3081750 RepID=UPI0029546DE8|nr:radical SAM protein [Anaerocolumna sp. AGMB13020]WOO36019.1 radical SAM protein [Anaerocolumna sp. AGMB13020]
MKSSKYNVNITIDKSKKMIYNNLNRNYVIYDSNKHEHIMGLLDNLNQGAYGVEDAALLKKMIHKQMIIKDNTDELEIIKFRENRVRFNNQVYSICILPTLDCNFRCVYCYEEHKKNIMDDAAAAKIVKYIENIAPNASYLYVSWFGGEPLMEFKRITELTEQFKSICSRYNCRYNAHITTNGYLLNEDVINKFKDLNITKAQITIDGLEEYHNKKRPLTNGMGTYKVIQENIINLLNKNPDVSIVLRINIDEENFNHIDEIFDIIPEQHRNRIEIALSNLFEAKDKLNLYELLKKSVDKTYNYSNVENNYQVCPACIVNGFSIAPDCTVIPCSHAAEEGYSLGYINEEGKFIIKDQNLYYRMKTVTALDNDKCVDCIKLPACTASCKYKRYKNNSICIGKSGEGISMEERSKLHYYSDLMHNRIQEVDML